MISKITNANGNCERYNKIYGHEVRCDLDKLIGLNISYDPE